MNMKSLLGQANKGIGKLKGFIFGGFSSLDDSQSTSNSQENQPKENPSSSSNVPKPLHSLNQKVQTPDKSKQKEETKSSSIIKSSKGQFDFSEEDDDEDSKQKKSQNEAEVYDENFEYSEPEEDYWKIAHRLYLKNSMVDIEPLPYVPFIKIKKNDNLLSLMGFGNKKPYREVKYFAVFDEHFLYMINMTIKDNNQNNFFKKVGNHYDLTKISNIEIKEDLVLQGKKLIKLVFLLDNDNNNFNTINKEFHFEKNDAIKFFAILKFYLKKYSVPLIFKDETKEKKEEKEDEDDEEEEEEDDDEEENKEGEKKVEDKKEEDKKEEDKKVEDKKDEDKKDGEQIEEKKSDDKKEEEKKVEEKEEDKKINEEKKDEGKEEKKEEENIEDKKEVKEEIKLDDKKEEKKEEKIEEKKEIN